MQLHTPVGTRDGADLRFPLQEGPLAVGLVDEGSAVDVQIVHGAGDAVLDKNTLNCVQSNLLVQHIVGVKNVMFAVPGNVVVVGEQPVHMICIVRVWFICFYARRFFVVKRVFFFRRVVLFRRRFVRFPPLLGGPIIEGLKDGCSEADDVHKFATTGFPVLLSGNGCLFVFAKAFWASMAATILATSCLAISLDLSSAAF